MLRILPLEEAQNFITRKAVRLAEAEQTVAPILEAVRKRGDEAVLEYARKFDGLEGNSVTVGEPEMRAAEASVSPEFHTALETAAKNIREYAEIQLPKESWVEFPDGRRVDLPARKAVACTGAELNDVSIVPAVAVAEAPAARRRAARRAALTHA